MTITIAGWAITAFILFAVVAKRCYHGAVIIVLRRIVKDNRIEIRVLRRTLAEERVLRGKLMGELIHLRRFKQRFTALIESTRKNRKK